MDGDDRLRDVSVVAKTDMINGMSEEGDTCKGDSVGMVPSSKRRDGEFQEVRRVDGDIFTPGCIRSLNEAKVLRLGIQLEVDLMKAQLLDGPDTSIQASVGLGPEINYNPQNPTVSIAHNQEEVGQSTSEENRVRIPVSPAPNKRILVKENGKETRKKKWQKKEREAGGSYKIRRAIFKVEEMSNF